MTRMSNAATQVEDWIKEQEDLDKAWQDILRNRVPKLKESLDMLKIGYFNTEDFSNSIRATIEEESQNRKQKEEEAKRVVVNGKQVSEEQAKLLIILLQKLAIINNLIMITPLRGNKLHEVEFLKLKLNNKVMILMKLLLKQLLKMKIKLLIKI